MTTTNIEQLAVNTIRTLSMDGVQAANSGHPGTPMALAPVTFQLWTERLRYSPAQPLWPNRDRFVLSCGHASMLLYSMIHLSEIRGTDHHGKLKDGVALKLEDLKNFRQLGSPCAGHPEYREASGIETTTGPLGAGCGNSVGMALAAKWLGSDGDLMEGVACEAASVAGHLKLSNLCWIYDDNRITIEGHTDLAFSENVGRRFEGLGWNVVEVLDANDLTALSAAYAKFAACQDKPTLIIVRSIIGWGSPNKADSHAAHGAPLGDEEIKLTKRNYGWPEEAKFLVPGEVLEYFRSTIGKRGNSAEADWQKSFADYCVKHPAEGGQLKSLFAGELPAGWDAGLKPFAADDKGLATRVSSGKVLNMLASHLPWLVGGSADLAPSTMTNLDKLGDFSASDYAGRNLHFGIREHAMGAICNGMSLSGLRAFGATFFVFTDYMRPAIRLSSIMHLPVLYVLTHDSIGLGEDGPTHQPVEHLAACRAIPGVYVYRPADANEVLECYRTLIQTKDHPAALVLSRQNVPTLDRSKYASASGVARGGYVVSPAAGPEKGLLMGTGSELILCLKAQELLAKEGIYCRVVSLPCFELFDQQDAAYRESVLPAALTLRVGCEAGIRQGWEKYLGTGGHFVGMSSFGASAPANKLYDHFKITADEIVRCVKSEL